MKITKTSALQAISQRRAVKSFAPLEIPADIREQLLDAARFAPSSFNMQPYRFYWIESPPQKSAAGELCLGQLPARTASALVVAVADIGALKSTSLRQIARMRQTNFSEEKILHYARTARIGRILFMPGPFGIFAALKWVLFRVLNLWKTLGMPPLSRQSLFKWATKSTALACQNLMIAAEALGLNSCPMEGFDGRRLSRFLGLSPRIHEIVTVIAVGKKSSQHVAQPQWRRPLDATVTYL